MNQECDIQMAMAVALNNEENCVIVLQSHRSGPSWIESGRFPKLNQKGLRAIEGPLIKAVAQVEPKIA